MKKIKISEKKSVKYLFLGTLCKLQLHDFS